MLTPLGNRVLIEVIDIKEKTHSGLLIPDSAKEKPQEGVVKAVGKDVKRVGIGNRILFGKFTGFDLKLQDTEYLILNEDDILAIV